ncbi:NUDIX domain-containing protein [Dactylosporangium sp. NPDC051541]|uniref:NUDIX domain-containing protein n=1 Tax=Dactylosporangium sp. NPDC051541 TaxID=3363977 RepID=UPI0037BA01DF
MRIPRAVAVVVEAGRVLVIKRFLRRSSAVGCVMCEERGWDGPDCQGHHYAVLPGGHVEAGESAEAAAVRELAEETGLRGRVGRRVWTGEERGRTGHYFLMADVTGVPVLSGPEAVANGPDNSFALLWAAPDSFEALNLRPAAVHPVLVTLLE